ncbi:MAG: DUF1566 domain-containing protein [Pseudomonadota bacterium]|nr:DUF1566 domain-containing protein [Pseudomonadota bacterium]
MKIQVCRNCGHKNTVVSRPFTSCNYCGSTELDPVTDTALPPGAVVADTSSGGALKWLILIVLLLVALGAAAWWGMQYLSDDKPFNPLNTSTPIADTSNKQKTSAVKELQRQTELNAADEKPISVAESSPQKEEEIVLVNEQPKTIQPEPEQVIDEQVKVIATAPLVSEDKAQAVEDKVEEIEQVKTVAKVDVKDTAQTITPQQVKPIVPKKVEPEVRVQPKKVVQKTVQKAAVPKPVQKVTKQVIPQKKSENQATAALQLKLEQEKVKKLQALLKSKEAKEERRNMRSLNRSQGVVTDAKTGLMWMACGIGQDWTGGNCSGETEEYLWSEAVSLAKDKSYAGYSDWRLPTRDELHSIVSCTNDRLDYKLGANGKVQIKNGVPQNGKCLGKFRRPAIDQRVFPNTAASLYWSYSFDARTNYSAWGVFFSSGHHYNYNASNLGMVRLVRNY